MTTPHKLIIVAGVAALLAATAPAHGEDAGTTDVATLIARLGSDRYAEREAADKALRALPRTALPELEAYRESPDPEISTRVHAIMAHILSDPRRIPQAIWALKGTSSRSSLRFEKTWNEALADWKKTAVTAAAHTEGRSGSGGTFAQSFIPRGRRIAAVGLCTYPVDNGWGWMRVDICEDAGGRPGSRILARAWIRVDKGFYGRPSVPLLYDIPDIAVAPDKVYWITFSEFHAKDSPREYLTNFGLSTEDEYGDGELIRGMGQHGHSRHDAKFIIYTKCDPIPTLNKLGPEALENLAEGAAAFKPWTELVGP